MSPTPILYPADPSVGDPGGADATFAAAALAWAADPTSVPKKTTMVNAYTADTTYSFVATGTAVVLHQSDGTDARWATCVTEAAATWTAAALVAHLAVPTALP
jgi:hypothetical protein